MQTAGFKAPGANKSAQSVGRRGFVAMRWAVESPDRRKTMKSWKWFGNAGHFICGQWCRFHLCTVVGGYLVSTVGQYWPERRVREIHAECQDRAWFMANGMLLGDKFDSVYFDRFGYQTLGLDRTFETMVFKAGEICKTVGCACGMPSMDGSEIDFLGYNDAKSATDGHMKMCRKWARRKIR